MDDEICLTDESFQVMKRHITNMLVEMKLAEGDPLVNAIGTSILRLSIDNFLDRYARALVGGFTGDFKVVRRWNNVR